MTWRSQYDERSIHTPGPSPQKPPLFPPISTFRTYNRGPYSSGQIRNAYIRVVEALTGAELARFDLTEDASTETAMVFGELYRHGPEWKFRAIGQGYASGLAGIARDYGVHIRTPPKCPIVSKLKTQSRIVS